MVDAARYVRGKHQKQIDLLRGPRAGRVQENQRGKHQRQTREADHGCRHPIISPRQRPGRGAVVLRAVYPLSADLRTGENRLLPKETVNARLDRRSHLTMVNALRCQFVAEKRAADEIDVRR